MFRTPVLLMALVASVFAVAESVKAAELAYWRFESGAELVDSSGNGNTLDDLRNAVASPGGIVDPVPLTGDPNGQKLEYNGLVGTRDAELSAELQSMNSMTVEAYFNTDTVASIQQIVAYSPRTTEIKFRLPLEFDNLTFQVFDASLTPSVISLPNVIVAGTNYFVAARYDASTGVQTIDLWDVDAGDVTPSSSVSGGFGVATNLHTIASGFNPLDIGMFGSGSSAGNFFDGTLDEIRISDTVLTDSQLLNAAIPEPASIALLGLGGVMMLKRRQRSTS